MRASKRHAEILKMLEVDGSLAIADIAARLDVSLETVRRDIRPLAEDGAIVRMHGSVALPSQLGEAPFEKRMRENSAAKKAIAKRLSSTIADGDSIMLDTGTTTSFLARDLLGHRRLTVITNSSDIARTLATVNGNRVYMAGGELRSDNGAAFGVPALEFVNRFSVTHAVISAGAIDDAGVMDFDLDEAEFARAVLACGQRRIAVSDASKFSRKGLVRVCAFSELTELVTDATPPFGIAEAIGQSGIALTIAR